jgi:hypothetical protein
MREERVQITRDNLINIPYLAHSPELFEMIDYTTMVSDHYYPMTPCITEIFDQYLRNYYSALVLKPKVYKPESFQGLTQVPELFEMIDYTTMVSDFTDLDPLHMYQRLKKVEEPRVSKSDELFSQTVYYLVLLCVYPITYPVVYVVHLMYCTVVGHQYLK